MLNKNVINRDDQKVVYNIEIIILFIAFLAILIFLYPKNSLQKQVLAESSNYDLTAIYLSNLLRLNPENSDLIFVMAKTLYQQQKYDLAINLLKILSKNRDKGISQDAMILHHKINNIRLEKEKNPDIIKRINRENEMLLKSIYGMKLSDIETQKELYYTAIRVDRRDIALKINRSILLDINHSKSDYIKWLREFYYLSDELNSTTDSIYALKELIKSDDSENTLVWLNSLFTLAGSKIEFNSLIRELNLDGIILADLYFIKNMYKESAIIYEREFKKERDESKKRALFLKIIKIYKSANNTKEAANIASRYEDIYLKDLDMVNTILKLYLEANRPDLAKSLSLKILKEKKIR